MNEVSQTAKLQTEPHCLLLALEPTDVQGANAEIIAVAIGTKLSLSSVEKDAEEIFAQLIFSTDEGDDEAVESRLIKVCNQGIVTSEALK